MWSNFKARSIMEGDLTSRVKADSSSVLVLFITD